MKASVNRSEEVLVMQNVDAKRAAVRSIAWLDGLVTPRKCDASAQIIRRPSRAVNEIGRRKQNDNLSSGIAITLPASS
jgi:hypothetical protein